MSKLQIRFAAKLKAGIKFDSEAKVYLTYAPALQLYSQGETKIVAKTALSDAIQLFLVAAYEKGVLEQYLKQAGFRPDGRQVDALRSGEDQFINIVEEQALEDQAFEDVFEVPASLQLVTS